jgi:hypothetical protein
LDEFTTAILADVQTIELVYDYNGLTKKLSEEIEALARALEIDDHTYEREPSTQTEAREGNSPSQLKRARVDNSMALAYTLRIS